MNTKVLTNNKNFKKLTCLDFEVDYQDYFSCDLLSFMMANIKEEQALITILNNLNVIAAASLMNIKVIIFAMSVEISSNLIKKAEEQQIIIYQTSLSTSEIIRGNYD